MRSTTCSTHIIKKGLFCLDTSMRKEKVRLHAGTYSIGIGRKFEPHDIPAIVEWPIECLNQEDERDDQQCRKEGLCGQLSAPLKAHIVKGPYQQKLL